MSDHRKTKAELIQELTELRQEVTRLKAVEADCIELKGQTVGQRLMSEARYRDLYTKTPAMLDSIDADGCIVDVSDYFLEVFGYEREEVIGRPVIEFMTEKSREYAQTVAIPTLIETGQTRDLPYQFEKNNGEVIDVLLSAVAEYDEVGNFTSSLAVLTDVTERERMLVEVKQSQEMLRSIIDATPDWIFIKDQKHRYRLANQGYASALHMKPEDFIGKNDLELGFPEELVKGNPDKGIRGFWADDRLVIDSGETQVYPNDPATIDGELHIFHTIKTPLRDAKGEIWGVLAFARDITEVTRTEEAVRKGVERYRRLFEDSPISLWEEDLSTVKSYIDRLHGEGVTDFRTFFDQQPEVVFEYANRAEVVEVNPATIKMYRAADKAEFFNGLGQIFGSESLETFKEEMIAIAAGRTQFEGESVHYALDGSRMNIFLSWSVVPGYEADYAKVAVSIMDITTQKETEKALRESQERSQTILESVTVPMLISSLADGKILYANQPLAETLLTTLDKLVGQPAPDFYVDPTDREMIVGQLRSQGFITDYELRLKRSNGELCWVLLTARLFNFQGEPAILTTLSDITERRQAQELLAKRATELEAVAQVSTTAATILQPDELLQDVADLTKERFDLYHVHIYLLDEAGERLSLAAGAGEVGRQMVAEGWSISLLRKKSLVAQAARERQGTIVNDVQADPSFLPNPLLPDTRSEMAIPMIVGERVLGVLDVQANEVNYFTQEDVRIQTTLAAQVAVALQNAWSYEQTQARVRHEQILRQITSRVRGSTNPDAIVRAAVRELGTALDRPTFVRLGNAEQLSKPRVKAETSDRSTSSPGGNGQGAGRPEGDE